mgnify:CR=1 FL=1
MIQPQRSAAPAEAVAAPVEARAGGTPFREAALFTHRGLSGPAILQVSSYWKRGDTVEIDPGDYLADVAVWTQDRLTIRGAGLGVRLIARRG